MYVESTSHDEKLDYMYATIQSLKIYRKIDMFIKYERSRMNVLAGIYRHFLQHNS